MLVNMNQVVKKEGKNIPQFNINNLEWTKYILEECNELENPVILGVSEGAIKYMGGPNTVVNVIKGLITDLSITIPVVIHLDHGKTFEMCQKVINSGFTSVMIDASKRPLEENIEITKKVVEYAKERNVSVEGEVGSIGGTEDNITDEEQYAKVEDCIKYVNETKIDFLAPALGSVHGLYKGKPNLQFDKMQELYEKLNIPLVLHGGSGLGNEDILKAIKSGIRKININTELQTQWTKAVREKLKTDNEVYDPRKIISAGENNIKAVVREKINLYK